MKSFSNKLLSFLLLCALVLSPTASFAIEIYDPTVDNAPGSGQATSSTYSGAGSNYSGVSDIAKAMNDPAASKSLTSCSKAVPAAQRAMLGLQYAKQDPTQNDTLSTIFNNIPQLLGGISATNSAYKNGSLTEESKKSWKNFGGNAANTATFGIYNKNQIKKAEVAGDNARIQELLEQETFRTECLDSIKIAIATNLLDRGTTEMVSLVQTGNFGDPLYVQNGHDWYQQVQDRTIINIFGTDLQARAAGQQLSNPYALATIQNIIASSRDTTFQERTKFTLGGILLNIQGRYGTGNGVDNIKADTASEIQALSNFKNDFNQGGWEGWLALTQDPANNPIGYALKAKDEVERQKANDEKATAIENSPQLLSLKKCTEELVSAQCIEVIDLDTGKVIATGADAAKLSSPGDADCSKEQSAKINTRAVKAKPNDPSCKKTTVVTPGSFITERMNWFITSDIRQLELANKFNSSISQILTASVNKIAQTGLDAIARNTKDVWNPEQSSSLRRYTTNRLQFLDGRGKANVTYKGTQYELFLDPNSPYWSDDFDLERDLNDVQIGCSINKGLYTTQKEYVEELEYMTNTKTSPLPLVIPSVAVLDMCVPGPTPIWQDLADPYFAEYMDAISSQDPQQLSSPDLAFTKITDLMKKHEKNAGTLNTVGTLTSAIAPVLPPPANGIGMIVGAGLNISSAIVKNQKIEGLKPGDYSAAIDTFQKYMPMALQDEAYKNKDDEINNTISAYESYVQYIYDTYSDENNLPVAAKARPVIGNLIEKNENIQATMAAYQSEYQASQAVLKELESIKIQTDAIYQVARNRMQKEYAQTAVDPNSKWDDLPAACMQICTEVKKPLPKPDFVEMGGLIRGFKLQNGVWTSGKSLRETIAGYNTTATQAPGRADEGLSNNAGVYNNDVNNGGGVSIPDNSTSVKPQ